MSICRNCGWTIFSDQESSQLLCTQCEIQELRKQVEIAQQEAEEQEAEADRLRHAIIGFCEWEESQWGGEYEHVGNLPYELETRVDQLRKVVGVKP